MALQHLTQFTTIASGDTVSAPIQVTNAHLTGIWSPVVDSCQIHLLGSIDPSSANFVRLTDPSLSDNSAGDDAHDVPFTWAVGPGSKGIILDNALRGFPQTKLETSVAQTDTRTLAVLLHFG